MDLTQLPVRPRNAVEAMTLLHLGLAPGERALLFVFCEPDGTPVVPAVVDGLPAGPGPDEREEVMATFALALDELEEGSTVAIGLHRPGGLCAGDDDRAWWCAARAAFGRRALAVPEVMLVSSAGVRSLGPDDLAGLGPSDSEE